MGNIFVRLIQKRILNKISDKRNKCYISINDAKKVGFVFNANDAGISDALLLLENYLNQKKIYFKGISIDISEEKLASPRFQSDPHLTIIYQSDMNWLSIPSHPLFDKFINEDFDLFFDLTLKGLFPVNYIIKSIKSYLIIGFDSNRKHYYDLLITKGDQISVYPPLSEYIKNAIEYLTSIKS